MNLIVPSVIDASKVSVVSKTTLIITLIFMPITVIFVIKVSHIAVLDIIIKVNVVSLEDESVKRIYHAHVTIVRRDLYQIEISRYIYANMIIFDRSRVGIVMRRSIALRTFANICQNELMNSGRVPNVQKLSVLGVELLHMNVCPPNSYDCSIIKDFQY
jgi:hypothetical protein